MAWLYLPVSVGLNSELILSSQSREPFVLSRGKPITLKSYKTKLKRNNWKKHLSLVTCEPSDKYVISSIKKWISLVPDSHVNRSQQQGIEREQKTKGGYGIQSLKLLGKFDPASYSWRTFQTSLMNLGHLTKFQNPFPKSGSILNGVLLERQTLVQTITETGYLYLDTNLNRSNSLLQYYPTPTKADGIRNSLTYGAGNPTLLGAVQTFPTPDASPEKYRLKGDSQASKSLNALHGGKLNPKWVEWLMGWPLGWSELEHAETE